VNRDVERRAARVDDPAGGPLRAAGERRDVRDRDRVSHPDADGEVGGGRRRNPVAGRTQQNQQQDRAPHHHARQS
jgi:hypothetical protein